VVARDCARRTTGSTGEKWTSLVAALRIEPGLLVKVVSLTFSDERKFSLSIVIAGDGSKEREGDLLRAMAETFDMREGTIDAVKEGRASTRQSYGGQFEDNLDRGCNSRRWSEIWRK
jgi:hypothetical protein